MNNLEKQLSKLTDKEFELFLFGLSHLEPVWKQISQEEYKKHMPLPNKDKIEGDDIKNLILNGDLYKVEPIYTESGLFAQLTAKPAGYKYYKRTGSKRVITVGSWLADAIIQRNKTETRWSKTV